MKEQQKQISKATILSGYDDDRVIDWIKELRYFSFYKGCLIPYLADGDKFNCDLKYTDKEDLMHVLRLLGIRFRFIKDSEARIIRGESYPADVFKRLPKASSEFIDIEEISKNMINGVRCAISIPKGYIHISIQKGQHEKGNRLIDRGCFEKALKIEEYIFEKGLEDRVTKDFQDYIGYVDKYKLKMIK